MKSTSKEDFIALEDAHALGLALAADQGDDWYEFSRIRDTHGKLLIRSYCSDGPFVFIDVVKDKAVSSLLFLIKNQELFVEKISERAIAQEAHRMFCWGVPLDLIKRQWGTKALGPVDTYLLSEATRYQLIKKQTAAAERKAKQSANLGTKDKTS